MRFLLGALALLMTQEGEVRMLLDPKVPMEQREQAVKKLATTRSGGEAILQLVADAKFPPELKATAAFACAASPEDAVRLRAADLLPLPKSKEKTPLPPIRRLTEMKGDAARGAAVYRRPEGPNCIGCHMVAEEGRQVGPPLTAISNKLSREQLFESILTPSAAILMSYENWVVRTTDGDVKTGIKVEETDDHITLKDNQGEYIDIPLPRIADRKQMTLSMMPENITESMTVQELVDLVEYLTTLR
ncbi:MAG TPA: c-type cytochrome [Planctomycetota bacterium]|nr:c-type cytochrome [Planctomycetota bacterium]